MVGYGQDRNQKCPVKCYNDRMKVQTQTSAFSLYFPQVLFANFLAAREFIIRNPEGHFPTYEQPIAQQAQIQKKYDESYKPLASHYDSTRENRAKGAGFYNFSGDEETRKAQMEDMMNVRTETVETRRNNNAVDVLPGQIEGMVVDPGPPKSNLAEKRKRDREERQKTIDAKRRKLRGEPDPATSAPPAPPAPSPPRTKVHTSPPSSTPLDPFAALEQIPSSSSSSSHDPFASLEKRSAPVKPSAGSSKSEADAFLESLGHDLLGGGRQR